MIANVLFRAIESNKRHNKSDFPANDSDSIYLRNNLNRPRVPETVHTYGFYAKQITCHRLCTVDRVKTVMTYADPNRDDNNDHFA